jgi:hypothetical protein
VLPVLPQLCPELPSQQFGDLGVELLLTVDLRNALLDVVGGINARFKF